MHTSITGSDGKSGDNTRWFGLLQAETTEKTRGVEGRYHFHLNFLLHLSLARQLPSVRHYSLAPNRKASGPFNNKRSFD